MLVLVLVAVALVETLLRDDLVWRPSTVVISVGLLSLLPWRRTRPLLAVTVVSGVLGTFDMVAIMAASTPEQAVLWMTGWLLLLPYALLR